MQINKLLQQKGLDLLLNILYLRGLISWAHNNIIERPGRRYVASQIDIFKCFIVGVLFGLAFLRAFHEY